MTDQAALAPKLPVARAVSAGGVVYRWRDGRLEFLLCGRKDPHLWALPKGAPDREESLPQAAAREVAEETGVQVAIVAKIGAIDYWFVRPEEGKRYHKTVHHYLMVPIGGDPAHHDREFDAVGWFTLEEARRIMTYKNEVQVVEQALALIPSRDALPVAEEQERGV